MASINDRNKIKPAIFLVEDIVDGRIVTFYEVMYNKLEKKLQSEQSQLRWLNEICNLLYNEPGSCIRFVKVKDFVESISITGKLPEDTEVYYFISCLHNLELTGIGDFLFMDPDVTDFLVKHKIPIILDTSSETCNHYRESLRLFIEGSHIHFPMFRGIKDLEFFVVGSTYLTDEIRTEFERPRISTVYHSIFPGAFFNYNYKGGMFNLELISRKQEIFDKIDNKQITEETLIWQAFSSHPRFNRALFQMRVEHDGFTSTGRYSRLIPVDDKTWHGWCLTLRNDLHSPNYYYVTPEQINKLKEIKVIDQEQAWPATNNSMIMRDHDVIFDIVLETFHFTNITDIYKTNALLTEKTAQRIVSGVPFITFGGHYLGKLLKSYGFKSYDPLVVSEEQMLIGELDDVIQNIKSMQETPLEKRIEIYESWKDILKYNFNRYMNIDVKEVYLNTLRQSKIDYHERKMIP